MINQPPMMDVEIEMVDEDTLREQQSERLQQFGASLGKQRDEWVRARNASGVDKRWIEDMDQYNGRDNVNKAASQMMTSVEQGYPVTTQNAKPHRSTVYIGLTRQKTNAAEARLADILLPTDDRNWGIQPTPNPKLVRMAKSMNQAVDPVSGQPMVDDQGNPLRHKEIANAIMEMAREKAEAMERAIEDQLVECDYLGELRKMIHYGAVLGTGVVKGPIVTNRMRKAWQPRVDAMGETIHEITIVEEREPATFSVDPRNCYPDPACGENIHDGKGHYERRLLTAKQVRELAKQPGYMKEQLRKVLEEGPKRSAALEELSDEVTRDQYKQTYEAWEYWGEVEHDDLQSAGVDVGDEDIMRSHNACIIIINNHVVKAFPNPLDGGDIPYDYYVWEKVANSCFGFGIPYLMRAQQKVLNAAWRQMMDNAGVSSGPQIVLNPNVIQPADKQFQLTSRKIWFATDEMDDVRKAFATFEFNSHQAELANIIKMASELADQETGMPAITEGQKVNTPDTVGGMQMLMNAANVVLRRLVKQFDDMVTRPHIRRYYDYNMMYNEDEEVKGDFTIDARGSSALLVRDIQNQAFMNLLAAGQNPVYSVYLDTEKLFKKSLQAQHIDPDEVFKAPEIIEKIKQQQEAAAANPQQMPPPQLQVAQVRAQAEMQKVQFQQQGMAGEMQFKAQMMREDRAAKIAELQLSREIEMLKLAQTKELTLEQIKAKLADTAIKERGKKELFAAEQRLKLAAGSGI